MPVESQIPQRPAHATILAVERSTAELAPLENVLTARGFGCHACQAPHQAVAIAGQESIDVFVCAAETAGGRGLALYAKVLEASPAYVPAIFLSSSQSADVIRRRLGTRGMYFLRRPWSSDVLITLIEGLIAVQDSPRSK